MASVMAKVLVFALIIVYVSASAIPMWEYLTKDEKMAYLYNAFESQVDDVCKGPKSHDCTKELLKYGLNNLHQMPEDHLDVMDPYQRDANDLIWKSMMDGHEMMEKKTTPTTPSPDRDIYQYFSESNYLGSASSRKETVLNSNGKYVAVPTTKIPKKEYGPMVVKVHLDGRPVQEEKVIPHDDDQHHYHIVKTKIPSLESFDTIRPTSNSLPLYRTNSPYPYAIYNRPQHRR